jgi:chorismate mutase/prephenate dehydratase
MSTVDKRLEATRKSIDSLDLNLLDLLSQRATLNQEVARIKAEGGEDHIFYRPEREAQLRRALVKANKGPLADEEISRLFQEIVSACRALQNSLRVAYLGPRGTFTEAALYRHFGHSVEGAPMESIDAVFRDVDAGSSHYGVVPVENSTEGVISHTLDMFIRSNLTISGEVQLRIHHQLLSKETSLDAVTTIYSHQQSLAQCRQWLLSNCATVALEAVSSNAEAARRVAGEPGTAAIAGKVAGEAYELGTLAANIEDESNNTTRFLVIGARAAEPTDKDKTSLLLAAKNRPGALYALLKPFSDHAVSLTKIESRPSRMAVWEYVFFVDVEGHRDDEKVAKALVEIEEHASLFKVLGSYPRTT